MKTENVTAQLLCNGVADCENKRDESPFICNPLHTKLYAIIPIFINIITALVAGIYLITFTDSSIKVTTVHHSDNGKIIKVINAIKLVKENTQNPSMDNEVRMKTEIQRLSLKLQLEVIKTSQTIFVKKHDTLESLFEPAVKAMFAYEVQVKPLLNRACCRQPKSILGFASSLFQCLF